MRAKAAMGNPYLHLLTTMVLWGSAFSSSKSVVEHVPPAVGAILRFGGGAVALLVAVRLFGDRRARVPTRDARRAAVVGVLGVFAYNGFFFWGLSLAPALDAGILIPVMSPVVTSAVLVLTGKERAGAARVAGLVLGLAGAVVFFVGVGGSTEGGSARIWGDLLFLFSALCWAGYTLLGSRVLSGVDPLRATTYATCAGALLLAVLAAPDLVAVPWGSLPAEVWLNTVYLAVGAAAVANLLYYRGVAAVGPARASLMMFTVPVINTLCCTLFLGETLGRMQALGAAVLLAGGGLAAIRGRFPTRRPAPAAHPRRDFATRDERSTP